MAWLLQEFLDQSISVIIAMVGVFGAALTALVALIGIRSNSQALAAKDAQIKGLKSTIENLGAFDAKNFLSQHQSQIELYERENSRLKSEVRELIGKLRAVEERVTDEQRVLAHLMGVGRIMGITDSELVLRRVAGIVKQRGFLRDFGDAKMEVSELYIHVMEVIIPDENAAKEIAQSAPEYILDEAIIPLLAVARMDSLSVRAYRLAEMITSAMSGTPLEWEMDIYRDAIAAAKDGFDFTLGSLPHELGIKMIQGNTKT